ncbi:MAG: formyltetrahydrofolate deformylase [Planctomycetaceae bacterium]
MPTHILLIDCPDQPGLIHSISGVLFRHGCNIVSNSEFVDREARQFFMRTEFSGDVDAGGIVKEIRGFVPKAVTIRLADNVPRKIVVLATKEPHCLGDLLIRHAYGELNAEISAVIANHNTLASLVERFDIPFHLVSHEGHDRDRHEAEIGLLLAAHAPEYIVLAKYMRILSPEFVARYPRQIINIHHSFLPAFVGAHPYRQAYERGVKIIGATAHFVTEELDTGPIIAQSVIPVDHGYSASDMARAGRDVEKLVLARALKLVFEERVFLSGNRTVIFE